MNGFTIRQAKLGDAERIYALIGRNADNLVPRSLANIVESIDRFVIAEMSSTLRRALSRSRSKSLRIRPFLSPSLKSTVRRKDYPIF